MEQKKEKQGIQVYKNKLPIKNGKFLYYNELPIEENYGIGYQGTIDGVPCTIFYKQASQATLAYLMDKYPLIKLYFEDVQEIAPTIIDRLVDYDRIYYFQIESDGEVHEMAAVLDLPLWETAENDFYELINIIHYCKDYEENPGGVFMDDYDLC